MITEDYVSFEIAKLLKEKGFNGLCTAYYDCFTTDNFHCGYEPTDFNSIDTKIRNIVAAPTIQMAMKWLRMVHKLNIQIWMLKDNGYWFDIDKILNAQYNHKFLYSSELEDIYFETHEQACETAIKYCLENLI